MHYFEKTFPLRISECDVNNLWRPDAILVEMQEIAGDHCSSMDAGRDTLLAHGVVWVLSRLHLQMNRYPATGETITLRTFHRPVRHRFFPRYFVITDASGETIGAASSLWLLMDFETRQSVSADRLPIPLLDNSDAPEPLPLPGAISALETPATEIAYEPLFTDLDPNGHVNNTKYADFLVNALGIETMRSHVIRDLTIHYNHELLPSHPLTLALRRDGDKAQLTGLRDGAAAFDIGAFLSELP